MRIFLIYLNSFFLSFFLFLFLFYHNTSIFQNAYFFFSGYKPSACKLFKNKLQICMQATIYRQKGLYYFYYCVLMFQSLALSWRSNPPRESRDIVTCEVTCQTCLSSNSEGHTTRKYSNFWLSNQCLSKHFKKTINPRYRCT